MRTLVAALMFAACSAASAAADDKYVVDDVTMHLPVPPEFCPLSSNPEGNQVHSGGNKVIVTVIPCEDLPRNGRGAAMNENGMWVLNALKDDATLPDDYSRQEVFDQLAASAPSIAIDKLAAAKKAIGKEPALGIKSIGIIDRDRDAIYMGVLATYVLEPGKPVDVASVTGMTALGGRVLSFNLNRPFKGRKTYDSLLAQVKQVMADAVAANKGSALEEGRATARRVEPPVAAVTVEPAAAPVQQTRSAIVGAMLSMIIVGVTVGIAAFVGHIRRKNRGAVSGGSQPYNASF